MTELEKINKAILLLERVYEQATLNGKVTVEIYKDISYFLDEMYESENKQL